MRPISGGEEIGVYIEASRQRKAVVGRDPTLMGLDPLCLKGSTQGFETTGYDCEEVDICLVACDDVSSLSEKND